MVALGTRVHVVSRLAYFAALVWRRRRLSVASRGRRTPDRTHREPVPRDRDVRGVGGVGSMHCCHKIFARLAPVAFGFCRRAFLVCPPRIVAAAGRVSLLENAEPRKVIAAGGQPGDWTGDGARPSTMLFSETALPAAAGSDAMNTAARELFPEAPQRLPRCRCRCLHIPGRRC